MAEVSVEESQDESKFQNSESAISIVEQDERFSDIEEDKNEISIIDTSHNKRKHKEIFYFLRR